MGHEIKITQYKTNWNKLQNPILNQPSVKRWNFVKKLIKKDIKITWVNQGWPAKPMTQVMKRG